MTTSRAPVIGGGLAVAFILLLLLVSGGDHDAPLDPRSDGPLGTSAMVTLLERLDAEVDLSTGLPDAGDEVALLLRDDLDDAQVGALERWVREGGTLVVTDPSSPLTPVAVSQEAADDPELLAPAYCTLDALAGLSEIDGGAAIRYDTTGADGSCFGGAGAGFVVREALGGGEIVAVGGAAFLTNERLDEEDNAVLAAALLAPGASTSLRVIDAPIPAGGGDKSLVDLISFGLRRAGLQLAVAFVLYALWRSIRLGRPVPDEQPVEIAGSELVSATGRLLERGRAPGAAAEVLRSGLRRALRARLGVAAEAPTEALVEVVAARAGADPEQVRLAVGDHPVTSEAELVTVARAVASIHQEVLRP